MKLINMIISWICDDSYLSYQDGKITSGVVGDVPVKVIDANTAIDNAGNIWDITNPLDCWVKDSPCI